jgi:hypothetical protein
MQRPKQRLEASLQHLKRNNLAMTDQSSQPLTGMWLPTYLKALHYGPDTVQKKLLSCLPSEKSRAFIVTGNSLATKTGLIQQVEELLKGIESSNARIFLVVEAHL